MKFNFLRYKRLRHPDLRFLHTDPKFLSCANTDKSFNLMVKYGYNKMISGSKPPPTLMPYVVIDYVEENAFFLCNFIITLNICSPQYLLLKGYNGKKSVLSYQYTTLHLIYRHV